MPLQKLKIKLMTFSKIALAIFVIASFLLVGCKEKKSSSSVVDEMVAKSKEKRKANAEQEVAAESKLSNPTAIEIGAIKLEYQSPYKFSKDAARSQSLRTMSPKIKDAAAYNLNIPQQQGTAGYSYFSYSEKPSVDGALEGIINGYLGMGDVKILSNKREDVSSRIGYDAKMATGSMSMKEASGQNYAEFSHLVIQAGNEMIIFTGVFEEPSNQGSKSFLELLNSIKSTSKQ